LGLAGLRLGFLAGAPALIQEFDKIRLPYNINVLTQASALFALEHHDVFEQQAAMIRAERHRMQEALSQMAGLHVYPSRANFILIKCLNTSASQVFFSLKENGILIKNLDPAGGLLSGCLRATVGTPEENALFLNALAKLV
jgi:histidinol-phosphate aminotransferase